MFNPGETITHAFIVPFGANELTTNNAKIYITYKQGDDVFLERLVTSGWTEEMRSVSRIEISFTQNEALLFEDHQHYIIQLNVEMKGVRMASQPIKGSTGIQLKREVIQ